MKKISHIIDLFNEKIGILTSYLAIPLILITFFVAFMRYALDFGSIAIQEITIYLHALIFTVGASYTLKNNMHVRIDIFYNKFSDNLKKNINLFGTIFFLLPSCILIFITSFNYVISSIILLESSKEAGGLPILYILKSYILLMVFTLFLQAISEIIKNCRKEL
ncbi:MAG: TRAP transporter small permease subunit [Gammaproteobacteria bacterium]|tara:strand:- start:1579 stop:2070 length:492 start_codon:yes stop_codon:yes gene_type:complete